MTLFLSRMLKKAKIKYIWWSRILFVRSKFRLSLYKKLKVNIFGGFLADQYVLYDFDNNDRREYLSEYDWYKSREINEPFVKMMDNKIICSEVMNHYIKVPKIYIVQNKYRLITFNDQVKNYDDIISLLKKEKNLYIKPISAGKGKGVFILRHQDNNLYVDETKYTKEAFIKFLKTKNDWLITEAAQNNEYLNNLYDKTTNTIRMITLRDPKTDKNKIAFAVQRIGTSKTIPVDNGSRGGLVANIDLKTGILGEARSLHALDVHTIHPDSKKPIKGVKVPNWDSIKKEMLDLSNKFPFMLFIAWDILLTEEGICIIEANSSSGVNIIQLWGPQRNGELGDFYRHHGIIK